MDEKLSDVCKAHEKEVATMNAANAVLKAQLEKALADSKHMAQVCHTHSLLNGAVQ